MPCSSRFKDKSCSLDPSVDHYIHVSLTPEGNVIARWKMVAQEIAINDLREHYPPGVYTDQKET